MENIIDSFGFDLHANGNDWAVKHNSKQMDFCKEYLQNGSVHRDSNGIVQRQNFLETFGNSSAMGFPQICNGTPYSLRNGSDVGNKTLPIEMIFNDAGLMSVIVYCLLFLVAACSNLTVFITLFRNRHRRSRINRFILHLSVADLCVTFLMMPLEIAWHLTVSWDAGDIACRIMMFFRAFGFYLSSFILVTISMDRYFAILHPLSVSDADKRGRLMLAFAWVLSFLASIPQSVIFHVEYHPQYQWFAQCVTFNFFPSEAHELAYNLFNMITVYVLPLLVIVASYSLILLEITRKSRESKVSSMGPSGDQSSSRLRRSGIGRMERARIRTLKMTIVIVMVFIACWTPYFVISAWWWFDRKSANALDPKIQRGLFLFAVSNSCMDPIVYGMFTLDFKKELKRCCHRNKRDSHRRSTMNPAAHGNGFTGHRATKSIALSRIGAADARRDASHFACNDDSRETTVTVTSTPERDRSTLSRSTSKLLRPVYQQNNFECKL